MYKDHTAAHGMMDNEALHWTRQEPDGRQQVNLSRWSVWPSAISMVDDFGKDTMKTVEVTI